MSQISEEPKTSKYKKKRSKSVMKKPKNQNLESLPTPKGSLRLGTKALGRNKSEFTLNGLS
mgnify:CR=1 FL=1